MQKGGDTLWEELYEAHYRELTAYGARMCGSRTGRQPKKAAALFVIAV